jgi:hypothetical protein
MGDLVSMRPQGMIGAAGLAFEEELAKGEMTWG